MRVSVYPLVIQHCYGKSQFLMGKSTINGPFSIVMLVYQRVSVLSAHLGDIFVDHLPIRVGTSAARRTA